MRRSSTAEKSPQKIHLVFKTHLDVGFTDFAANVKEKYFSTYIPKAIELAQALRHSERGERYVWTTGSWLIYEFLEHASPRDRGRLEEAIIAGDIAWHGLPFSTHSELMDPSLFRFGLSISQDLDRRFGKATIAAKMTDVPGHTRGIVPLLAEAGIRLLHIGVNPSSTPPDVPPAFIWRNSDGSDVIVVYQKGGYGDLTTLAGVPSALAFAFTSDNVGPHTSDQVKEIFRYWRDRYAGVPVAASTLDAFARDLLKSKPQLPVITDEIGDTWIHGAGSDPTKMRRYRELCRLRKQWLADGTAAALGDGFTRFSRSLLMIPEHTWGLDEKAHLADHLNYSASAFANARDGENFKKMEASWAEQRGYVEEALTALEAPRPAAQARKRLAETDPALPSKSGYRKVTENGASFETTHFSVGFDCADGSIIRLTHKESGRDWAGESNRLARFTYEVFSQEDYDRFLDQYEYNRKTEWFANDFSKPSIAGVSPTHRRWRPRLDGIWIRTDALGTRFILEMAAPPEAAVDFGCPASLFIEARFPVGERTVQFNVQWFNKNACRMPEAMWLSFSPKVVRASGWTVNKMGQRISPLEVIRNGNRKLHAVGKGVEYRDDRGGLVIDSLDAPLVAPGEMSLLDFNNRHPPLRRGMHFNLYNNLWGTNFPMWFEDDARFRFILKCTSPV